MHQNPTIHDNPLILVKRLINQHSNPTETVLFVTGRLAEKSLRKVVAELQQQCNLEAQVVVLPISVAALMTPEWIENNISIPANIDRVILPGFCAGDLSVITHPPNVSIEIGPKDLRFLPEFFGQEQLKPNLEEYDIEIIAEINHAPRMSIGEIVELAKSFSKSGANVIDVGCEVDNVWPAVGECIRAIRDLGLRVSIDSLIPREIQMATEAGAELVLSVNSSNINAVAELGTEVVLIPDDPQQLGCGNWIQLERNMELLESKQVDFRIDPIVEPIGFDFAASLNRYIQVRQRWPQVPMMMGIGNLTEMTEVDSAGVNLLLLAICQELDIQSVLTTEVISWARSAVKECDIARRIVRHSIHEKTPPKHVDSRLVCLRDPKVVDLGLESIAEMAQQIKDFNFRIFADDGEIHLLGGGLHLRGTDSFKLFDDLTEQLRAIGRKELTASHAFYLGAELNKAAIALQLGKQYCQDEALNWGYLTIEEQQRHRISNRHK